MKNRRIVLRGMMGGAAVTVGLPILDGFLNSNGTAFADGKALPVCFGTWLWGLGCDPGHWEPKTAGTKYEFGSQMAALQPFRDDTNLFIGLKVYLDSHAASPHNAGWIGCTTGSPAPPSFASIDTIVADTIGTRTRFKSLEVACDGTKTSVSRKGTTANASENSPVALYQRVFGPEFKDPNAAEFTPDVGDMMRKSALSAITEQRQDLMKRLGAADRAGVDEYFTSIRELEKQLQIMLERPAPLEACTLPTKGDEAPPGYIIDDAVTNNKLFAKILAHAMACGQTNVVNVLFSEPLSNLRRAGSSMTYHMYTHEEAIDTSVGYQIESDKFRRQCFTALADLLTTLKGFKEGPGTLLDRMLLLGFTDVGYAKTHGVDNMPMLTFGKAGGRIKTGHAIEAKGDSVARVGLTVQQALGVRTSTWGTESNTTKRPFAEIMNV